MKKTEMFYVVGECIDSDKYCRRKGLVPRKTITKILDGKSFPVVVEYAKGNANYVALSGKECYSGYVVTLMRLPELPFEELLSVALTTKRVADRAGALGIILKKHEHAFERYLNAVNSNEELDHVQKRQIAMVTTFVYDFIRENTSLIWDQEKILSLCEELKSKYANVLPQSKWVRLFLYGI